MPLCQGCELVQWQIMRMISIEQSITHEMGFTTQILLNTNRSCDGITHTHYSQASLLEHKFVKESFHYPESTPRNEKGHINITMFFTLAKHKSTEDHSTEMIKEQWSIDWRKQKIC